MTIYITCEDIVTMQKPGALALPFPGYTKYVMLSHPKHNLYHRTNKKQHINVIPV